MRLIEFCPCDWVTAATDQPTSLDARDTLTSKNSASFFSLELSIIELSKSVEQKSGSKQNCPNGHIHSNRQTLFQLLTHSQKKAVQIFSESQNGTWETLL